MNAHKILDNLITKIITCKRNLSPEQKNEFIEACKTQFSQYLSTLSKEYDNNGNNLSETKTEYMQNHLRQYGMNWIQTPLECILAVKSQDQLFVNFNNACNQYGFSLNFDAIDPKSGATPLHYACGVWNENLINLLCNADSVNKQDRAGFTPAHFVGLSLNPKDKLETLKNMGADLSIESKNGYTPETIRPQIEFDDKGFNCLECTKLPYIGRGPNFTIESIKAYLITLGDEKAIATYLNSTNIMDKCTAIYSAFSGNVKAIELIHQFGGGASFNIANNLGYTALHYAMTFHPENLDFIKALVEGGADFDLRSKEIPSPYSFAEQHDLSQTVQYFNECNQDKLLEKTKSLSFSGSNSNPSSNPGDKAQKIPTAEQSQQSVMKPN